MADPKVKLTIVVAGTDTSQDVSPKAPLESTFEKALHDAEIVGERDRTKWEYKREDGSILDATKSIEGLGFGAGGTVYLSRKAGATG